MFQAAVKRIAQRGIKGVLRDLAPACVLLFVSCFMLFIYEPNLLYATNMDDFWFDFHIMIWPVLSMFVIFFLAGIVVILAVYTADLLVTNRLLLYKGMILAGFVIFFLLYLQGNWLAGSLPPLTGEEIPWENYGKYENIVLISATVILIGAMIVSIKKQGLDRTVFYSTACTSVVFVMLSAALIPTVLTNNALDSKKDAFIPTLKNYNTISSNNNFLILLIDTVDSQTCYDTMMEDDDFRGILEDFTYYPDTLCVYPYTKYALPNILTGTMSRNETRFRDYSSSAYNQSELFEALTQNGYDINLYSRFIIWEGEKNYNIENAVPISDVSVDLYSFLKQEVKYILFKYLPYGLKQLSRATTLDFEWCKKTRSEYGDYFWELSNNYECITENRVLDKQNDNYFQFIHCEGSHTPYDVDKDLNTVKDGTYKQKLEASLTLLKEYLQRLKDNDSYDNSVIVILADHSSQTKTATLRQFNPILFIKGINEKHEMLVSDRSVSYADLQDAFRDLIDGKQSTELFAELEPGRTRTMLWHDVLPDYRTQGYQLFEYTTTGTVSELEKLTPTGNVYDVKG